MDLDKVTIVVCLTLFIVIGVNAFIYASLRRGGQVRTIEMLRRATSRARDPWQIENEALQELSDLTAKLRKDRDTENGEIEGKDHRPGNG